MSDIIFLEDKLLQIYQVKGGRKVKYSEMKRILLNYNKKNKVEGTDYWRKQLELAHPSSDELLGYLRNETDRNGGLRI